ncbi:hypothetical protein PHYBOEH_006235 [Phytophthora boehmeriae]|uniref:Cyclic nucleotide-binding domain-containing protein n=1 Tax=Phytophthora boehmeriae TaxID=109152 RepID=A0A8T1X2X6_9STRA|nr:hypothetical protein PHYBOEH_006235 [Phytophthora boehmeriae]
MTLSPGEEYENYQKVHAKMLDDKVYMTDDIDAVEEGEDGDEDNDAVTVFSPVNHQSNNANGSPDPEDLRKPTGVTASSGKRTFPHIPRILLGKDDLQLPPLRMINPLGRFRLFWDIISIYFIFYNALVLPFKASFDVTANDSGFESFLDIFFAIDIILTFNTAVEKDGSISYSRRLAAERYVRTWFAVDLIAAMPYKYMVPESNAYLRRSVKLLRLVRLLRLLRISRILRRIQNAIFIRSTLSSLMKYCLMVLFISHWFSCCFHAIGSADIERSWIKRYGLDEPYAGKWDRYIAALYVSVQTLSTIGFGDIAGVSANERLFCIFAMIIGGGIFAYGITNIVELVSSLTIQETIFRQKLDEVNEYMSARELPAKLRMEIREFYHNTRQSRESKLNAEQQILNDLSSKLRSKIALSINDQFLRKFPFFTGSEPNFLMELALNMRVIHFAALEDAIVEGEIGHEMFFIFRGAVEVVKKGVRVGILGENQYFGEMAILSPDNRRTATVRTLCFCELRMLSRTRFLEALALFPAMQSKMAQIAQGRGGGLQAINEKHKQRSFRLGGGLKANVFALSQAMSKSERNGSNGSLTASTKASQNTSTSKLPTSTSLTEEPVRRPSAARLPLEQRPSERITGSARATTSIRINSNVRRGSGSVAPGVTAGMTIMINEVASLLEEATRRQDVLLTQVQKLMASLEGVRAPKGIPGEIDPNRNLPAKE